MVKYLFMNSILRSLSRGKILNTVISVILWIIAVVTALSLLVSWILLWKLFSILRGSAILGGLIFQLIFVVMSYMIVHVLIIRAKDIKILPESDFVAIPIVSILLKLAGELYASSIVPLSIGSGIAIWFGAKELGSFLSDSKFFNLFSGLSSGFVSGFLLMLSGIFSSIFALVFLYYIAEMIYIYVEIEKNTRPLRQGITFKESETGTKKCPNCGADVREGDNFCDKCGTKISD